MWVIVIQDHEMKVAEVCGPLEQEECVALLASWGYTSISPSKWMGRDQWANIIELSDPKLFMKSPSN